MFDTKRYRSIENLYVVIWTFYSIASILLTGTTLNEQNTFAHVLYEMCSICTIILLLFLIFFVRWYSKRRLLFNILSMIIIAGIALSTRGTNILIGIMFMLLASYIDVKKIIWFDMKLKLTLLLVILLLCRFGVLENRAGYAKEIYKQSLGFSNQNNLAAFVCIILLEWLFLCHDTAKKHQYFIILIIIYILNYISKGRSSIYSFLVVLFLFILARWKPQIFYIKLTKYIFTLVTPILAISCFLMIYLYRNGNIFMTSINRIMTNRIYYAEYTLLRANVKFMGGLLPSGAKLDMGYVHCVVRFGLLFLICTCLAYPIQFIRFLEEKQIGVVLLMLFYVISGLGESFMFNIVYNVSMLYLFSFNDRIKAVDKNTEFSVVN